MGYVPGRKWDLFLSYAHYDKDWVRAFLDELEPGLRNRLGLPVSIWQDARELVPGEVWTDEIRQALEGSAALVSILSPSYFESMWCRLERERLIPNEEALANFRVDNASRLLKVIKTPTPDRLEDGMYETLQAVCFCAGDDEFPRGTPQWTAGMKDALTGLTELLRIMRNKQEPLYVAPPATEHLAADYKQLREQMEDKGYNVLPGRGWGSGVVKPDEVRAKLEGVAGSVFLLGADYNEFLDQQIQLAIDSETRMFLWPQPAAAKATGKQAELLERLRSSSELPKGSQLMGGKSVRDFIDDLFELLHPKTAAASNGAAGNKVYLLYDTTDPEDAAVARQLDTWMRDRKLEVFAPDPSAAMSDRLARHDEFMRACNGVLLYRGPASNPDNWLKQTMPDVLLAEFKYSRSPLKAKGVAVDDPGALAQMPATGLDLISARDMSPAKLEPFFTKLVA